MINYTTENLIPAAAGTGRVPAIKIGGQVFPISVSESMDFYKCASVDTANHTWTGYKAVSDNGIYTFEQNVTGGLTYSSVTPVIGNVYSDGALVRGNLYTGYTEPLRVFEAVLSSQIAAAATGQSLTYTGTPRFVQDSVLGRYVADFSHTGSEDYWYIATPSNISSWFPSGNSEVSAMVRFKNTNPVGEYYPFGMWGDYSYTNTGFSLKINVDTSYLQFETSGPGSLAVRASNCVTSDGNWHTAFVTYDKTTFKIYLDRVLKGSQDSTISFNGQYTPFWLARGNQYDGNGAQLISDVKIWNLCLTQEDINQISPD